MTVIALVIGIPLFLGLIALIALNSGESYQSKKDRQTAIFSERYKDREASRMQAIRDVWEPQIAKEVRSGSVKHALHLFGLMNKELEIQPRIDAHNTGPKLGKKLHPKTGHAKGGFGRAGHKPSHNNPVVKTKTAKAAKKPNTGLRKIIIGEPKPIIFKGRKK
jgi:hypothetical protein